ncbi:MAG: signal recognition particle-docking protein FtsY [Wigglesworthia glossinidia]|nr:signal recognition particle-docking protein FtsY [Wigglesworthia glossinidia]
MNNKNIKKKSNFLKTFNSKIFSNIKLSLINSQKYFGKKLSNLFQLKKIDEKLFNEIEAHLLSADLGIYTTKKIINSLIFLNKKKNITCSNDLYILLKKEILNILLKVQIPLTFQQQMPFIILMVGVNGVGKTTTIIKMAYKYKLEGKKVIIAAGDTFRAGAIEQIKTLGEIYNIPVIFDYYKSDAASVVFKAINYAKKNDFQILIIDTAGRLHNKINLMEELKKIVKVIKKLDSTAPHEIMIAIDAHTGQNTINQVNVFNNSINISGITLTKLDGTAKGGTIIALADKFYIPIRYIGSGKNIQDLYQFQSSMFLEALFSKKK